MARKVLTRLLALAGAVLAAGLLVEAGVRLAGLDSPLVWEPDPELGWTHIPGARRLWTEEGRGLIEINSHGLRDRERPVDKPTGTFRVAVFGDSMTEGVQVNLDQTYAYRLEERLSRGPRPVEVLNFGVNGYSPQQELLLFRREGPRFRPDLVILAVFTDNDVADCHPDLRSGSAGSPFAAVADGGLRWDFSRAERSYAGYHAQPMYAVRKYSATYRCLGDRLRRMGDVRRAQAAPAAAIPKRYGLYQVRPAPAWEEAWATFEYVALAFAAEARGQGVPLVLLSVPAGQVVNAAAWRDVLAANPAMAAAAWDLDQPERRLATFADRHDLPLIQPADEYRRAGQDPPLFFGGAGHFTPAGHDLMARAVAAYLTEHRLVPTKDRAAER